MVLAMEDVMELLHLAALCMDVLIRLLATMTLQLKWMMGLVMLLMYVEYALVVENLVQVALTL
jgi:hypothetical protein